MSNNQGVRDAAVTVALGIAPSTMSLVVFATVAFSLLISVLLLLTRGGGGSVYDQIGAGGISRGEDYGAAAPPAIDSPAGQAEREREIRQLLGARNERRVRN
ncbi:MAG TPA: hypothetical protein VMD79_05670, partial [Solirubrobacteraceae bacterium]|nr:hypothetical protein [Solirubrobacteraceae bacterium]